MQHKSDMKIIDLINVQILSDFMNGRGDLRKEAKKHIAKVLQENHKTCYMRRRYATKFKCNDLFAIKRTLFGPGLKLKPKFLGQYKITKPKPNNTYDVEKCSYFDGPMKTSTYAEFLKSWTTTDIT